MDNLPPLSSLDPEYVAAFGGGKLRDTAIAFTVIEVLFVFFRFLSKFLGKVKFGIDDWLVASSLVVCIACNVACIIDVDYGGVGKHIIVLLLTHPEKVVVWEKFLVVLPMLYFMAVCLPKMAILVFYDRIFVHKVQRILNYTVMGLVIATSISGLVTAPIACITLEALWNPAVHGRCLSISNYYRYGTLPNSFTDIAMLLLPLPMILGLQTSFKIRLGVLATFLTGSVGLVASIVRLITFFKHDPKLDGTWSAVTFCTWVIVEPGCYLLAACFISLRPLLKLVFGKMNDAVGSSRSRKGSEAVPTITKSSTIKWSTSNRDETSPHNIGIALIDRHPLPFSMNSRQMGSRLEDEENLVGTHRQRQFYQL